MNRLNFLIILLIFFSSNVFAGGGGKAYMPVWRNYSNEVTSWHTGIHLTNLTSSIISVKLSFIESDGTMLYDTNDSFLSCDNCLSYVENQTEGPSIKLTIRGKEQVNIKNLPYFTDYKFGYAITEWSYHADDKIYEKGLLASGLAQSKNKAEHIVINGASPF